MNSDIFDDLPDHLKDAIRDMMKRIQEIDPDELEKMMKQIFGEDFIDKMKDMPFSGATGGFPVDPNLAKEFETMMKNMMKEDGSTVEVEKELVVEEPYYEISPAIEGAGQIVVELPGVEDVRQVKWERSTYGIDLTAESKEQKYAVDIPLSENIKLKDMFASMKNSIFILPYKSE